MASGLTDDELQKLYTWIDEIPLSRPKRNISRDFADCVLVAEVIGHYFPKIVQLHNYSAANSSPQKLYNWNTMNTKVLKKLGWQVTKDEIEGIIMARPGFIERFLHQLQFKMAKYRANGGPVRSAVANNPPPPVQQQQQPQQPQQSYNQGAIPPPPPVSATGYDRGALQKEVDEEILLDKEQTIQELKETVEILELKIAKLEQLVRLKDSKITKLQQQVGGVQSN
ncbi:hypothetical protein TrVE_jg3159 [Triparma verrucosa]|uniref:Calponin-homology (CH) domain-containing protein n=1 Tax=Triparma verrucosa TaxID=1606542 RepID=A0A9W7BIP7_9STRA|nr:hypothetical protein TrVE_jg3159 [Triparma verrucosa]